MKQRSKRRSCLPLTLLSLLALLVLALVLGGVYTPKLAWKAFGEPAAGLSEWQRFTYGLNLAMHETDITQPVDPAGKAKTFEIQPDESVSAITAKLEAAGLIRSAATFRNYLIWTGADTIIRSGTYQLSPAQNGVEIAKALKPASLTEVKFTVFPGWRMEEIAASIPTSGLAFTPEDFLQAALQPVNPPAFLPAGASAEGFLAPGVYTLLRTTSAEQLVYLLLQNTAAIITPDLQDGFTKQGLSTYQAVTLASIIQREAMEEEEMPLIASVFFNRLAAGMLLQTDPTVQYALGYNQAGATWWTSPLTTEALQMNSPYNTYINTGLPPGPISNPGQAALRAVANPAQSNYFYFQARCDGSGRHNFAETLEQHQQNNCP